MSGKIRFGRMFRSKKIRVEATWVIRSPNYKILKL